MYGKNLLQFKKRRVLVCSGRFYILKQNCFILIICPSGYRLCVHWPDAGSGSQPQSVQLHLQKAQASPNWQTQARTAAGQTGVQECQLCISQQARYPGFKGNTDFIGQCRLLSNMTVNINGH